MKQGTKYLIGCTESRDNRIDELLQELSEKEAQLDRMKRNTLSLSMSLSDAPYHGVTREEVNGMRFALNKILEGTGLDIKSLIVERDEKGWFSP